jgi:capsular polysaccharide biosynthesis protein
MTINEDQIDLRPYILTILRNKWLIIIIPIILAAGAIIYSRFQPEQYSAQATLLLTRSRPVLSLAQQFPTVNEPIDSRSRMDAMMTIAGSDSLIQQTIDAIGDSLPDNYASVEILKKRLTLQNKGDSIIISATSEDPKVSADLANAWSRQIVETINTAYSGEQPFFEIQQQLISSKLDYEAAQAELESFINQNPRKSLEQKYYELEIIFNLLVTDKAVQMEQLIKRKQTMQELAFQAEALKKQLQGSARSNAGNQGDALAVILARMKSLGIQRTSTTAEATSSTSSSNTPPMTSQTSPNQPADVVLNIQIDGANGTPDQTSDYVADIDSLLKLLEEETLRTETAIQTLTEVLAGENVSSALDLDNTAVKLQNLATEIEKTKAKEQELTSNRDLTWDAYQALVEKETEIKNAALTNNQVTLASTAIAPNLPESRGTLQKAVIAVVFGIAIGIAWAILREWWKSFPRTNGNK